MTNCKGKLAFSSTTHFTGILQFYPLWLNHWPQSEADSTIQWNNEILLSCPVLIDYWLNQESIIHHVTPMSNGGFVVLSLASSQHWVLQYQPIKQHSVIILTSTVEEYQRLSNHYTYQLLAQSADKDCLHVLFVSQPQKSDIVKNLQSPMYTFRAHRAVENHHIVEYSAMQDPAHSRTMFVHNASDWVAIRNIAVSANYENYGATRLMRKTPSWLKGDIQSLESATCFWIPTTN